MLAVGSEENFYCSALFNFYDQIIEFKPTNTVVTEVEKRKNHFKKKLCLLCTVFSFFLCFCQTPKKQEDNSIKAHFYSSLASPNVKNNC